MVKTELRRRVRIVTGGEDCKSGCGGTGLQLYNSFKNHLNALEVIVRVCPCVRLVVQNSGIVAEERNGK